MSSTDTKEGSALSGGTWRNLFWMIAVVGLAMLRYEYLWTRFALGNPGRISFMGWFWTVVEIAVPWIFCFGCVRELRRGVRNGKVDQGVCSEMSVLIASAALFAYVSLAPEIQRLTSLGALR